MKMAILEMTCFCILCVAFMLIGAWIYNGVVPAYQ